MSQRPLKRRVFSFVLSLVLAFACAAPALAAKTPEDEEADKWEARYEGYPTNVRLEKSGTAMAWFLFAFLGLMGIAVLFKNARRTHLD